ncbi:hypothetical protein MTO96_025765 [Rhipicephalus appendiculatus]
MAQRRRGRPPGRAARGGAPPSTESRGGTACTAGPGRTHAGPPERRPRRLPRGDAGLYTPRTTRYHAGGQTTARRDPSRTPRRRSSKSASRVAGRCPWSNKPAQHGWWCGGPAFPRGARDALAPQGAQVHGPRVQAGVGARRRARFFFVATGHSSQHSTLTPVGNGTTQPARRAAGRVAHRFQRSRLLAGSRCRVAPSFLTLPLGSGGRAHSRFSRGARARCRRPALACASRCPPRTRTGSAGEEVAAASA